MQALDFWMSYPEYLADELADLFVETGDPAHLEDARRIFDFDEPDLRTVPMMRF